MGDDEGELLRWDPVIPMMRAGAMRLPLSQEFSPDVLCREKGVPYEPGSLF